MEHIEAVDVTALDWLSTLRASLECQPEAKFDQEPTPKQRGWLVGQLNKLTDESGRHAFLQAAFGNPSSKSWTTAHYDALRRWLQDGGEDLVPRIAKAALKAQEIAGEEPTRKENNMNVAKLIQEASVYGYEGAGDVMAVLEVDDISEFDGAIDDALAILQAAAQKDEPKEEAVEETEVVEEAPEEMTDEITKRYIEQCAALPEAPVLAWTRYQRSPTGPVVTLSVRAGLEPELMTFAVRETLNVMSRFETWLEKVGGSPVLDGRDRTPAFEYPQAATPPPAGPPQAESPATAPPQAAPPQNGPPQAARPQATPPPAGPPQTAPPQAGNGSEIETFEVVSIERDLTTKGDNLYKVRGGKYHSYGVSGYEAVEADVNELLGGEYDISNLPLKQRWACAQYGWTARAERPAGEQYAKKVVGIDG